MKRYIVFILLLLFSNIIYCVENKENKENKEFKIEIREPIVISYVGLYQRLLDEPSFMVVVKKNNDDNLLYIPLRYFESFSSSTLLCFKKIGETVDYKGLYILDRTFNDLESNFYKFIKDDLV